MLGNIRFSIFEAGDAVSRWLSVPGRSNKLDFGDHILGCLVYGRDFGDETLFVDILKLLVLHLSLQISAVLCYSSCSENRKRSCRLMKRSHGNGLQPSREKMRCTELASSDSMTSKFQRRATKWCRSDTVTLHDDHRGGRVFDDWTRFIPPR